MRNIVIVDPLSTGYNFIEDVIRRGYHPVALETGIDEDAEFSAMRSDYALFYHQPDWIREAGTYEETLEKVKAYDPVLVLAGAESGVVLATRLAEDLGLPGNRTANLDKMTRKDGMHEALKAAGLRYIHGEKVSTPEEAEDFCRENGLKTAVVKPLQSAASQGLYLCDSVEEVKAAVKALVGSDDVYGRPISQVLVQERIYGTEYIVNTISSNGVHRLSSMMRYRKKKTEEGGYIYESAVFVTKIEPGLGALVEYALKVADAIGYLYGEIHGEYMVDKKGPVLIEVNCRPMGASMPGEYLDRILGQHETDSVLDSYLDPEKFRREAQKPYRLARKGYLKLIMVPEDMEAESHPIWEVARQLRSTWKISAKGPDTTVFHPKTRDLESNGGIIYLVHDDEKILDMHMQILRQIEEKYFELLLNDGMSRPWFLKGEEAEDPAEMIRRFDCHGSTLLATDKETEIEGVQCVTPKTLDEAHKGFDNVIIAYRESLIGWRENDCLFLMFATMEKARRGGRVIIPESTYRYISYGREGAEVLMTVKGLTVEAPRAGETGYVAGTNTRD